MCVCVGRARGGVCECVDVVQIHHILQTRAGSNTGDHVIKSILLSM